MPEHPHEGNGSTAAAEPRPPRTREQYATHLSSLTDDALLAECRDRALAELARQAVRPGWGWDACWLECRRRGRMALLARAVEEAGARRSPAARPAAARRFVLDLGAEGVLQ
jgi:hypothetical protein